MFYPKRINNIPGSTVSVVVVALETVLLSVSDIGTALVAVTVAVVVVVVAVVVVFADEVVPVYSATSSVVVTFTEALM